MSKIIIIGAGFSGISAAAYLSAAGNEVHVFEKNESAGGRARQFKTSSGYVFDMGPSWYWMPEVFEKFFNDFGHTSSDHYDLKLLNPSFEVVYGVNDTIEVPENFQELCILFESIEKGSASKLLKFMKEAEYKYQTGMNNLIYKPGFSISELVNLETIKGVFRLQVFSSFSKHVRNYFSNPKLIALMEFPVLFLGAMPKNTPALYSLMNYAGLKLGTWYPQGGFGTVIDSMKKIAELNGAVFHFNAPINKIEIENNRVISVLANNTRHNCEGVIASADYHHVESKLLPDEYRNYDDSYWKNKTFAPSCLIYYLGVRKKIKSLHHHTLFFDESLDQHAKEIYEDPKWPEKPLFYVCCPSKSDDSVAPNGHENLFMLMPLASGLEDDENTREKYFKIMLSRLETLTNENIESFIDYKKSYCVNDFIVDYNSYNGNAYGLANTLTQTAFLKPKLKNNIISNLFYAGQLTVPGPGVPPSIISGKIAAQQLALQLNKPKYEASI